MAEPLPPSYDPHAAAARFGRAWEAAGVFVADPAAPGAPFSVVIPPPNVTGRLHMGHALNNTLQDVLTRYKRMDGFNAVWVPGTDHAGIATQWVVRKQLAAQGIDYRTLGRDGFLEKVWAWKAQSGGMIKDQLQQLGVSCDWSRERFTMDPQLSNAVTEHFVQLFEKGLIYRGQRLINWDPLDQTALSDLEVEHDTEHVGELYEFAYKIREEDGGGEIVVATTRPETMLGDTAVAVHPDDPRYQHLIGKTVQHPFVDRAIPIIADAILVDVAFGTGCVKITPAHDFNDFEVGKRHNLPMINILELDGTINAVGGQFRGLPVAQARIAVKEALEALGLARGTKAHPMSLGKSQRSGAVVEPMISTQWFMKMQPLAEPAIQAVQNGDTRFVPKQWENTYFAWLRDIKDWCISRQLWWGHRIPAWYGPDGQVYVGRSEEAVRQAHGLGASVILRQDEDVLDTWFSSALWPFSVFGWPEQTADLARYYPTSVLVTGFDIIFFWVARMMFAGLEFTGQVPFKDVYIHALVRDKEGEKMSKTRGNVVDPLEAIEKYGCDAFRFTMTAFAAQGRDVLWDEKRVEANGRFVTKIWQALRYAFMHAEGYDPSAPMDFGPHERWIQVRTGEAVKRVREALDAYKFNEVASEIHSFVWNEFCDWYIELSKSDIYDENGTAARKNAVKHTLFETWRAIARLAHPVMPFLTEEIWSRLPGTEGFVTTQPFPKASDFPADDGVLAEIAALQDCIGEVRRIRGEMRLAGRIALRLLIADPGLLARLRPHAKALDDVAGVALEELVTRPNGVAVAVVQGHEVVIPLEGVIDFSEEVKRLDKELLKIEKDQSDLEKRLGNADFVSRAPPSVLEDFRAKLELARKRQETLSESRKRFAEAL